MEQPNITFIGAGNMARAIISGMIKSGYPAHKITASARTSDHLTELQQSYGIAVTTDNSIAVQDAEVIVLAVKPKTIESVCKEIAAHVNDQLIISVAAGQSCSDIKESLNSDVSVARAMPNTACLLSKGAIGIFLEEDNQENSANKMVIEKLFTTVGNLFWLDSEKLIDTVTAVSGSGPAYYFYLSEALTQAAIKHGLDETTSRALVAQTAFGAAAMMIEPSTDSNSEPVESLRKKVTSPNGTTEAAIKVFDDAKLMTTIDNAIDAAVSRAKELSK